MDKSYSYLLERYPDRVPILVDPPKGVNLEKRKYLVQRDMTTGQFTSLIRKRMQLKPHEAVFMFVNNDTLPPVSIDIGTLHREHAEPSGILCVKYCRENVFGGWRGVASGLVASVATYFILGANPEPSDPDHEDIRSVLAFLSGIVVSGLQ